MDNAESEYFDQSCVDIMCGAAGRHTLHYAGPASVKGSRFK